MGTRRRGDIAVFRTGRLFLSESRPQCEHHPQHPRRTYDPQHVAPPSAPKIQTHRVGQFIGVRSCCLAFLADVHMLIPVYNGPPVSSEAPEAAAVDLAKTLGVAGPLFFRLPHSTAVSGGDAAQHYKPFLHATRCIVGPFPLSAEGVDTAAGFLNAGAASVVFDAAVGDAAAASEAEAAAAAGAGGDPRVQLRAAADAVVELCSELPAARVALEAPVAASPSADELADLGAWMGAVKAAAAGGMFLRPASVEAAATWFDALTKELSKQLRAGGAVCLCGAVSSAQVARAHVLTIGARGIAGLRAASLGDAPAPEVAPWPSAAPDGSLLCVAECFAACARTDRPDGLFTTVVTDERGTALGLVYSSTESMHEAIRSRRGVYYSRSRGGLWRKGDSSGAVQHLCRVDLDCDSDAVLFAVQQLGSPPAFCHLNTRTCWGEDGGLSHLERVLEGRRKDAPAGSYTKRLFDDPALLRAKLLEEAQELSEAVEPDHVAAEAADVMYFAMVRCAAAGVKLADIERHLDRRSLKIKRRPGNAKPARIAAAEKELAAVAAAAAAGK